MERPERIIINKELTNGIIVSKEIKDTLEKILFATGAEIVKLKDGTQYELYRSYAYISQSKSLGPGKKEAKDIPMLFFEYKRL